MFKLKCKAGALNAHLDLVSSRVRIVAIIAAAVLLHGDVYACLWDADTMRTEQSRHPQMADVVLGKNAIRENEAQLQKRIANLRAAPHEGDADWWNNLAGAHIRLGELETAIKLLEPLTNRFGDDYGIHANLGTAYHLQGRFVEAEREIARDLQINPDAHFGLEKYHLALLQYLARDAEYQKRHLYIDEWTYIFWTFPGRGPRYSKPENNILAKAPDAASAPAKGVDPEISPPAGASSETANGYWAVRAMFDPPPAYRYRWNLANDPKFQEGVLYMASLNSGQPACFVMLGIACLRNHDYNLAAAAYERAIQLGSRQSDPLKRCIEDIRGFIRESRTHSYAPWFAIFLGIACVFGLYWAFRRMVSWIFGLRR